MWMGIARLDELQFCYCSRVACCCWALGGKSTDGLMGTPQWAGDLEEAVAARAWLTGVSCRQQMGWHSGVIRRELALLSGPWSELGLCNSTSDKLPIHYLATTFPLVL